MYFITICAIDSVSFILVLVLLILVFRRKRMSTSICSILGLVLILIYIFSDFMWFYILSGGSGYLSEDGNQLSWSLWQATKDIQDFLLRAGFFILIITFLKQSLHKHD